MSDIITIENGKYELNSSISVSIDTSLEFNFGENYLLVGDNGVGKSSFVSKLLLPLIIPMSENNFKIFYIPQDVTIQYYLVKYYYNGLLNEQHDFATIGDALNLVKSKMLDYKNSTTNQIIFILQD
jgi:ABC-type Mn2+/Zn2+ transport system ATPase subunit